MPNASVRINHFDGWIGVEWEQGSVDKWDIAITKVTIGESPCVYEILSDNAVADIERAVCELDDV